MRTNKILTRIPRREFLAVIIVSQRIHIAIFGIVLRLTANSIPLFLDGALEIDHARIIGGSPPASLRAFAFGASPKRHSYGCPLRRVRADCRHHLRDLVGSSVLIFGNLGWRRRLCAVPTEF